MAYDPAEPRDSKGRWSKEETTAWLAKHPIDSKNIVDMWDQATAGEKDSGEVWYPNAHRVAQALGKRYGVSTQEAAGLLATYSPQTPWGQNVTMAAEALREDRPLGGPGAHIWYHHDEKTPNTVEEREGVMAPGVSRNRAARIMAGEDPEEVFAGGRNKNGSLKPNSLKIRAFADLIANGVQGDPENPHVVIDRHAAGVARGVRMTDDDYGFEGPSSSVKKFEAYASAYREAARVISEREGKTVPPEAVQAVTWLVRQRLNGQMQTGVGSTRSKLGEQDARDLQSYIDQYLPEARTFLPKVGYENLSNREHAKVDIDLASANAQRKPKPQQQVQAQPPPQTTQTGTAVAAVAAILLAGGAASAIEDKVHGVLSRWRIDKATVHEVMKIVRQGTAHVPRASGDQHVINVRTYDLYYRAAYICNAAFRLMKGESPAEERRYFAQHEAARKHRLAAAQQVETAAAFFGQPVEGGTMLGWYLNPLLNNEAECIAANGHNFLAEKGTLIGYPGAVHTGCGCYAGPPHTAAAMVDEVLGNVRALHPVTSRAKFRLRESKRKGA